MSKACRRDAKKGSPSSTNHLGPNGDEYSKDGKGNHAGEHRLAEPGIHSRLWPTSKSPAYERIKTAWIRRLRFFEKPEIVLDIVIHNFQVCSGLRAFKQISADDKTTLLSALHQIS